MWALVILVSLVAGVFGLVCVIYPLGILGITSRKRAAALVVGSIAAMLAGGANYEPDNESKPTVAALAATPAAAPVVVIDPRPGAQQQFNRIVTEARVQHRAGQTDFQKGATRPSRAKALCQSSLGQNLTDWIGKVTTLSTNGDGLGVLQVGIADNIALKTWNNALSDINQNTLIKPGTRVFSQMGTLKKGDRVKFSAKLFKSDTDCFREGSVSLSGSMNDPEFIAAFSSIEKI